MVRYPIPQADKNLDLHGVVRRAAFTGTLVWILMIVMAALACIK